MTSTTITISTAPANRKEIGEAFGPNQSAVRRIESLTKDVTVNLPDAIGGAGDVAAQALALAQAIQQLAFVLVAPSGTAPAGVTIDNGVGIGISISGGVLEISLSVPVAVGAGGTGVESPSGQALDNITAFSGTGLLARTAAAAYSFVPVDAYLMAASNLSDLASVPIARTNLGLGTMATQESGAVAIAGGAIDDVTLGATAPVQGIANAGLLSSGRYGSAGLMVLRSAAGTQAAPTAIAAAAVLTDMQFQGYDGANYQSVGWLRAGSDGAISAAASPGYIAIYTTPAGTVAPIERMRIASGGNVQIGSAVATVGAEILQVAGSLSISSAVMLRTYTAFTNGAAAAAGTLTNAPVAGNPTKWVPVNDNGTTRYIPMW